MDNKIVSAMYDVNPVINSHVRKFEYNRFTTAQPFPLDQNPSEILIDTRASSLDSLTVLDRAYVALRFKLVTAGNGDIAAGQYQVVQQGWDCFSRAILYINDSEVENIERPGKVCTVKSFVEKTGDEVRQNGPSGSFYPRTLSRNVPLIAPSAAIAFAAGPPVIVAAPANPNISPDDSMADAQLRYQTPDQVHTIKLRLADVFGFADVPMKSLLGSRLSIRLTPETAFARIIHRATNSTAAKIQMRGCDLYVPTFRPDSKTLTEIYSLAASGQPQIFEYETYQMFGFANASANTEYVIPSSAKRPTAVHLMYYADAAGNDYAVDKLVTQPMVFGVNRLMVDSRQYPETQNAGSDRDYITEYQAFLDCGGFGQLSPFGGYLSFEKWKNLYTVLSFDLSSSRDDYGAVRSNNAILQLNVVHPATAATTLNTFVVSKQVRHLNVINGNLQVSSPDFTD